MKNILLNYKFFFLQFIYFVKNPDNQIPNFQTRNQNLREVCYYFFILDFVITLLLRYITEIMEKLILFTFPMSKNDIKLSMVEMVIIGIIISPLVEETVFRYPLKFLGKNNFKWKLYLFCTIFALLHLTNYQINSDHILYIPFILKIQIFAGFILSYIRLKYGFWYGVMLHSMGNACSLIWLNTIGFDI